jgi:hypothetical protein
VETATYQGVAHVLEWRMPRACGGGVSTQCDAPGAAEASEVCMIVSEVGFVLGWASSEGNVALMGSVKIKSIMDEPPDQRDLSC